jgi:hypothetical protein
LGTSKFHPRKLAPSNNFHSFKKISLMRSPWVSCVRKSPHLNADAPPLPASAHLLAAAVLEQGEELAQGR